MTKCTYCPEKADAGKCDNCDRRICSEHASSWTAPADETPTVTTCNPLPDAHHTTPCGTTS